MCSYFGVRIWKEINWVISNYYIYVKTKIQSIPQKTFLLPKHQMYNSKESSSSEADSRSAGQNIL